MTLRLRGISVLTHSERYHWERCPKRQETRCGVLCGLCGGKGYVWTPPADGPLAYYLERRRLNGTWP